MLPIVVIEYVARSARSSDMSDATDYPRVEVSNPHADDSLEMIEYAIRLQSVTRLCSALPTVSGNPPVKEAIWETLESET
jgi:hypothetical protein